MKTPWKVWSLLFVFCLGCTPAQSEETQKPKNVILFIGDGMGVEHVTLARLAKGSPLYLDQFPFVGMSRTYCEDNTVTDSAAAATALASGWKTRRGAISMVKKEGKWQKVQTLMEFLRDRHNYSVGLVTTTRITHATPAAFLSHVSQRNLEGKIASQLARARASVLLGGGLKYFAKYVRSLSLDTARPELLDKGEISEKLQKALTLSDNKVRPLQKGSIWLVEGKIFFLLWRATRRSVRVYALKAPLLDFLKQGYQIALDKNSLQKAKADAPVLGLFSSSHMSYETDRKGLEKNEPSLSQMVRKALRILEVKKRPFFLMVEGGRIDHAGHAHDALTIAREVLAFDQAIGVALKWMEKHPNTLVVVTSDHGTGNLGISKAFSLEKFRKKLEVYPPSSEVLTRKVLFGKEDPVQLLEREGVSGLSVAEKRHLYPLGNYKQRSRKLGKALGHIRSVRFGLYFFPLDYHGTTRPEHTGGNIPVYAFGPRGKVFCGVWENRDLPLKIAQALGIPFRPSILSTPSKVKGKVQ